MRLSRLGVQDLRDLRAGLGEHALVARVREGLDPVGRERLVLALAGNREVGATEEGRRIPAGDMARHWIGTHLGREGLGCGATLRVEHVRPLPAVADERGRAPLGERNAREWMGFVVRLARPREAPDHALEHSQALDRLRRVERALPLAALVYGDLAAVVGDEGHGDVPVLA